MTDMVSVMVNWNTDYEHLVMMMTMENSCKCYDDEHCQRRTQQQQIPHGMWKTEEQKKK